MPVIVTVGDNQSGRDREKCLAEVTEAMDFEDREENSLDEALDARTVDTCHCYREMKGDRV